MITTMLGKSKDAASKTKEKQAAAHICEDPPVNGGSQSYGVNVKDGAVMGRGRARPESNQAPVCSRDGMVQKWLVAGKLEITRNLNEKPSDKKCQLTEGRSQPLLIALPVSIINVEVSGAIPAPNLINHTGGGFLTASRITAQAATANDSNNLKSGTGTLPTESDKPNTGDSKSKDIATNPEPLSKDEKRSTESAESTDNDFKMFFAKVMESLEKRGFSFGAGPEAP